MGDTLVQAADCLAEAIAGRIARSEEIPPPSKPNRGQQIVGVPFHLAPKLALYLAMRERRMPNAELAKRLGVSDFRPRCRHSASPIPKLQTERGVESVLRYVIRAKTHFPGHLAFFYRFGQLFRGGCRQRRSQFGDSRSVH